VPAEFPGTSLSCISIFPKRNSLLDWKPEPEALSSERLRRSPLLSIFPRPSPHVMSKSWSKLAAARATKELRRVRARNTNGALEQVEEVMVVAKLWKSIERWMFLTLKTCLVFIYSASEEIRIKWSKEMHGKVQSAKL